MMGKKVMNLKYKFLRKFCGLASREYLELFRLVIAREDIAVRRSAVAS